MYTQRSPAETCLMAENMGFSSHGTNHTALGMGQYISKSGYFIWVPGQNERLLILHCWFPMVSDVPIVIES